MGLIGSQTTLACGPFGLVSNVAHPDPTTPGCACAKQCWPPTAAQHSLFAGQSLGPSHVMLPVPLAVPSPQTANGGARPPTSVHPCDAGQATLGPFESLQLTWPATSIVPRQ